MTTSAAQQASTSSSTPSTTPSSSLPPFYTDTSLPLIPTPHHTSSTHATDPFTTEASNMALSHNVFIRGFNSIYQTAPRLFPPPASPPPSTTEAQDGSPNTSTAAVAIGGGFSASQLERARADFVAYCLAWVRLVDEHHRLEEERIFPEVERIVGEAGLMGREEEEHVAIHDGITNFQNYLTNLTSPSTLSATKLLSILDSFSGPFHAHLTSEPLTLVALQRFSAAFSAANTTLVEVSLAEGKKSMASLDFVVNVLPCFLLNMEFEEFEDGYWKGRWPAIGGMGRWALFNVVPAWHSGWWRFASCDSSGRRKRLVV